MANFESFESAWTSGQSEDEFRVLNIECRKKAEEELNETPDNHKKRMMELQAQIMKDTNLIVPNNEDFLLRFLRARKFDSKKAFNMMQRYYLMKLKCPELFGYSLPSEYEHVFDLQAQYMLPDRDHDGRRIFIIRVDYFDASRVTIEDVFRTNILALEGAVKESETQVSGIVVILDMAGLSLQHAKFFTPYYAKKMVELVQETFPLRFKGFHVVNEPFYFDAVMTVLKPFLKEKIRKRKIYLKECIGNDEWQPGSEKYRSSYFHICHHTRKWRVKIYLHGNDTNSLHAFIPASVLPQEYGGTKANFNNRSWYLKLISDEKFFLEQQQYGYKMVND